MNALAQALYWLVAIVLGGIWFAWVLAINGLFIF
ncbi:hypothetical protein SEEM1594_14303 [Salmonella enterica subsp. enterica serovar Muenchen str. baa1594]|nr:hypothetical protein SEEM1594_14303 [Salmonella enterica subsp. enterica serovar Muenchen str. baa1594]